jgi:hypothetical protein
MIWTVLHSLNAAQIARARLSRYGVRINPSCRLARAQRIVQSSLQYADTEPLAYDVAQRLVEAHRTIIEWYLITATLGEVAAFSLDALNIAMGGADVPDADADSRPRDLQFELLVGSLVHHAGITGVSLGEPDIRIQAGARTLGIAAKRLTSSAQLSKRVRKATDQIARLGDYGVIAINVDRLATEVAERHGIEVARARVNALTTEVHDAAHKLHNGHFVAGVYGFATLIGWQAEADGVVMMIEAIAAGHWSGPEEDRAKMRDFLRARGARLERTLNLLVSRLV